MYFKDGRVRVPHPEMAGCEYLISYIYIVEYYNIPPSYMGGFKEGECVAQY